MKVLFNGSDLLGFGGFTCQARGDVCLYWEKEEEEEVGTCTT